VAGRLEQVQREFMKEAAKYQSVFTQQEYMKQIAGIETAKQQAYSNYQQKSFDNALSSFQAKDASARGWKALSLEQQQVSMQREKLDMDKAAADAAETHTPVLISPVTGKKYAMDPQRLVGIDGKPLVNGEQMAKFDEKWQANAALGSMMRDLTDKSSAMGSKYRGLLNKTKLFTDKDRQDAESLHADLRSKLIQKLFGATSTAQQEAMVDAMIGDLESFTKAGPQVALRGMTERTGADQQRMADSLGLTDESGRKYNAKEEFFIPEDAKPKAPTAGSALNRLNTIDFSDPMTGKDTIKGAIEDAKTVVKNLDNLTPPQMAKAYATLMEKAESADAKTAKVLLNQAKAIEARLRVSKMFNSAEQQATGGNQMISTEHNLFQSDMPPMYIEDALGRINQ
jgi:hypothetical protein